MLQGEKVNDSSLIEIKSKVFFGYDYDTIINMDFRKSEGRKLLKKCGLSSSELKYFISQDLQNKERKINITPEKKNLLTKINLGEIKDISILKKHNYREIKGVLKKIGLNFKGKKEFLISELFNFSKFVNNSIKHINKLILCQSIIKGFIVRSRFYYQGPAYLNRKISVNDTDFYTCESIKSIPDNYFFSYKDKDGFVYSYDIRSFTGLIENDCCNPYTTLSIGPDIVKKYNLRMEQIKNSSIKLEEYKDDIELSDKQKFDQRVLDIFQRINKLGHYSHSEWFTNLSSKRLKVWYKEAEDIFNYRAQLSESEKKKIIPDGKAFQIRVSDVYKIPDTNKRKIQDIVLNEISRFISLGTSQSDRYTGSLYMLTALTLVSINAATALPWLYQNVV